MSKLNNQLINLNSTPTMSSREIAELTNKNHADVMRDIRNIEAELSLSISAESEYVNSRNQKHPEYLLTKENSLLVVSGYSVTLRKRIIDRWQELENKQHMNMPQTFAEALQLAADQARQIEILELDNKETKQERNAALNTVNKLGDVLLYQARVLEAREEDRKELNQIYKRKHR